jgi:hypothetical protein
MARGNLANFKGKHAAPFKKGGGRRQDHPNTAKGQPRKRVAKKGK